MEPRQEHGDGTGKHKRRRHSKRVDELTHAAAQEAESAIEERVEQVRELVDDLRDRAEMAFHERPYLLPVAAGAVGLGVGVLIGSKVSRMLFFTAAGAMLSDTIRGRLFDISRDFIRDLGKKTSADDIEDIDEIDDLEPSVT